MIYPNGFMRTKRSAFVIHPLSQQYFKNVKPIELLSRVSPPQFMNSLEKVLACAPPFINSRVTGIQSPTGVTAEEVTLVAPETAKLLALKESTRRETPDAKVVLSAHADTRLANMAMVATATATSGAGKAVLAIMKVKPGGVITDVARSLDLPAKDVAKCPDVPVIESGEILLPGDLRMKSIGLPKNVAYTCLAETIVLALQGRFENYTVRRTIERDEVRKIYQSGLKHGMRLAAISGVNGVFSDGNIARVRTLALAARAGAVASSKKPAGVSLNNRSVSAPALWVARPGVG